MWFRPQVYKILTPRKLCLGHFGRHSTLLAASFHTLDAVGTVLGEWGWFGMLPSSSYPQAPHLMTHAKSTADAAQTLLVHCEMLWPPVCTRNWERSYMTHATPLPAHGANAGCDLAGVAPVVIPVPSHSFHSAGPDLITLSPSSIWLIKYAYAMKSDACAPNRSLKYNLDQIFQDVFQLKSKLSTIKSEGGANLLFVHMASLRCYLIIGTWTKPCPTWGWSSSCPTTPSDERVCCMVTFF